MQQPLFRVKNFPVSLDLIKVINLNKYKIGVVAVKLAVLSVGQGGSMAEAAGR